MFKIYFLLVLLIVGAVEGAKKEYIDDLSFQKSSTSMGVVKLPVYDNQFVQVVVGNPSKHIRLEVSHQCGPESVVLFQFDEELSKTYTVHPNTIVMYLGHIVIRVPYVVRPEYKKNYYYFQYHGILCLGPGSALWDHWTKASVSKHRLVFGEYDMSMARNAYKPYSILFGKFCSHNVTVFDHVYHLKYDPSSLTTKLPKSLYHNVTDMRIHFENMVFFVEHKDLVVSVVNGFDHTMVTKTNDDQIVLGKQFAHTFVHYIDVVANTILVMPTFDHFESNRSEIWYVWICVGVYVLITVRWIAHALSPTNDKEKAYRSIVKTEVFLQLVSILLVFIDSYVFKNQRNINFVISTTDNVPYALFVSFLVATSVGGLFAALLKAPTSLRRIFNEWTIASSAWLIFSHLSYRFSIAMVLFLIAATNTIIRNVHLVVSVVLSRKDNVTFVSILYTIFANLFLWFYNMGPLIEHFYYGFADHYLYSSMIALIIVYIPSVSIASVVLSSVLRNTLLNIFPKKNFKK